MFYKKCSTKTVSVCRKEAWNKGKQFPPDRNSFSTSTNKVLNVFLIISVTEKGFHKTENPCPPQEMKSSFKNTFLVDEK